MSYLLDTNVVSELRKGPRASAAVLRWYSDLAEEQIFLSVLTIGEIRRGIENVSGRDPRAAIALETWVRRLTLQHEERILPVDRTIAEGWGRLNAPNPLPVVDGLLAATALVHDLTLATRNVRDVARAGVRWVDPFSGGGPLAGVSP